jgi:putative transposase
MDIEQRTDPFSISAELWARIEPLIPVPQPKRRDRPGRPRQSSRQMMAAIFYVLRTGCQWKSLPRSMGAASTVHERFQEWCAAGVFARMWQAGLHEYDALKGLDWEWQAMDGAMTKAPLGGKRNRRQPHGSR